MQDKHPGMTAAAMKAAGRNQWSLCIQEGNPDTDKLWATTGSQYSSSVCSGGEMAEIHKEHWGRINTGLNI